MASSINASTSGAGGLITTADNTGILQLQTGGTTAMTIDTSQNVGIGTTSPTGRLQIGDATVSTSNKLLFGKAQAASEAFLPVIGQQSSTGFGNDLALATTSSSGVIRLYTGVSTNSGEIGTGSNTERMRIDSSGYAQGTVNGLGAGRMPAYQYYRLNSTVAGTQALTAQNLLGVGVTLVGSTTYEFEIVVALTKSAGTTSHNITLGFGGTATLNNIGYSVYGTGSSASSNSVGAYTTNNNSYGYGTSSTLQVVTACVTASVGLTYTIKGTVSVNAGGTFIPQYTLSADPGGAYTTQIGSYIKIAPLSASGSNTSIGTWA